jgi:superfamily II DNA or RNA helicase
MIPRPYQIEALNNIRQELEDKNSTLLVMATGLGKTITFSQLAHEFMRWGRVMVLAHRGELIYQAHKHLDKITGCTPDIEMADYHASTLNKSPVVVSTIQTQIAGRNGKHRMQKFDPKEFSLLIIDESHHSPAQSYKRVIDYYQQNKDLKILGVTATPDRADEKALGQIFESVAYEYGILEGINNGWLVPINQKAVHVEGLDFSACRTTAGDLNNKDLAAVMEFEDILHRIASPTIELSDNKKTLIFASSLAHAERLTEIINRHRPSEAKWVHGGTPKDERADLFRGYAEDKFQYLSNVGVATEGFDEPGIGMVAMGRPTKSRSLYAQMIGRGTRTLPGTIDGIGDSVARRSAIALSFKPTLEVLDFVGNSGRHRLITTTDLLGGDYNDDVIERAKKNIENKGEGDVLTELQQAEKELEAEAVSKEGALRRERLKARAEYSTAKINPFNVFDIEPVRVKGWNEGREPTQKQLAFLERKGVDCSGLGFQHASQLIERIIKNQNDKLCTFKQAKLLSRFRYNPKDMTFKEAGELIDKIAQNGWRRPT